MKNKVELKKFFISIFITLLILTSIFSIYFIHQYKTYTRGYNDKIVKLVSTIKEKHPSISDEEIFNILNDDTYNEELFLKYGYSLNDTSIVNKNDNIFKIYLVIDITLIIISFIILIIIFYLYLSKRDKDIKEITKCIEEINKKNYELQIDTISEDELSILKNEIYKTTIMLKEAAENSNLDKLNLKKSLEDISHQLKTPLTSIMVMLDNIIEDPDMDKEVRNDFIIDIKRNVYNISFLVQSILKLSKFDANTVKFIEEKHSLKDIVDESIKNVSPLCDLRNITIKECIKKDSIITCDEKWQIEAVTNILKNSIDHSITGNEVTVIVSSNNAYSEITISDNGCGISSKDMPHIFERFYKGENSSSDSIGIGLALAKTIIEENNGSISVESSKEGTTFSIKYFTL